MPANFTSRVYPYTNSCLLIGHRTPQFFLADHGTEPTKRRLHSIGFQTPTENLHLSDPNSTANLSSTNSTNSTPVTSLKTSPTQLPITMPRQRSGGRAPARPSVPARSNPAPTRQQQTRPATTYAPTGRPATAQQAPPAPAASQGPGLMGQMASTAA